MIRAGLALFAAMMGATVFGQDRKPVATTVQLPTFGISIDAEGQLAVKTFQDPTGQLAAQRIAAARRSLPTPMAHPSDLRKISLARLEREVVRRAAAGQRMDEPLRYLAGLQRIQYVFLFPEANDIVLAGPADGFFPDASGRMVGITTGRAVLRLDDLAVALRAYAEGAAGKPFLGCTIDPRLDGLARLRQFQKTIPNVVSAQQRDAVAAYTVQGTQEALGHADVRVFGVSPATHFAHVMIEADYRMKCMAVGTEPPPVSLTTFVSALRSPPANLLQRWWFTPNYQCVRVSDDRLAMEMVGQGVQLLTEDKVIAPDGRLSASTSPPLPAAAAFAKSFTERYPAVAAKSPVYAELRNVIDLAIVAAWLKRNDAWTQIDWKPAALLNEEQFSIETLPIPKTAACVVNAVWSGNRLISPAGGGVSILPDEALRDDNLLPPDPAVEIQRAKATEGRPADTWWWD